MRRKVIAGNWKMNKTTSEAIELTNGLMRELYKIEDVEIIVCPPFTALEEASEVVYESNIKLGAQNMHWETNGAFTGEVSPAMLKELGCQFVILGHSERRQYFHETNENVNKKSIAALKNGLTPIVCVGERLEEREANKAFQVIQNHVEGSLSGISSEDIKKVIIAYEPVWAIGTGKTASPAQAQEVHQFIRELLKKKYGAEISEEIIILYGGSVKPNNTKELVTQNDIDGALVGGASLEIKSFAEIVNAASNKE
ncbi:MAG: triose-phosphate isomerase [Candidatus Omnitrophica bacterium CG1_02_44_16]|nr:MAG: triose-phosphate isomerase [Candidatus Omnitrophica bacterium CG1_02_44_16]PIY83080.1 MAG: triose-phosphate isomerase [Candidatus Omnitrophica bacterium CG_4_10_14_0_8_um_filter_44_12]PIZ83407.1 MAG: triose-phosphate isomerase [Candidatus Omnitrophica bacterium CG_4_10_14_0_2_um_filter_44_9]